MTSNENKFEISSNDSKSENEELPEGKSEDVFSHSHPALTEKNKVLNLAKRINSKQFPSPNSGSGSGKSAFFSSLESINSIIEEKNWVPKVLYVVKPKNSSDNNFEVASATFVSNKLKPPIPSEWGTEKTELPESERLENLNILLNSEPCIPLPEKKKKKKRQSKVKDSNKDSNFDFFYDTSFDPEKEFLELNSRYPPSPPKNLEKSSKSRLNSSDNLTKKKKADIEFWLESSGEILPNSSNESELSSSLDYSISENEIIIRNSKKEHNFQEKPIVHTSNPFLQLQQKRVSKPYEPYLPHQLKKKSLDQNKSRKKKEKVFESKPGTSKMESEYESLSSSASEFEIDKKCHLSSLEIDKPFSDFSLQGMRLDTFGNKIKAHKSIKTQISELVRKSREKLHSPFSSTSSANTFQAKSIEDNLHLEGENCTDKIKVSSDQDSILNEVPLEQSLKEFSERKEDNEHNKEENNINEEEDEYLVFSWSSTDLGISRWSLPSRATSLSNSIVDRLSVNYVVNSVVKRFIDVRKLAPVIYSQRPAGNFREYDQEVDQEAGASHK